MPDPRYQWNESAGRYIDPSGRFVSRAAVQGAIESALTGSTRDIERAGLDLQAGRITLGQWQTVMRREIKNVTIYSAASTKGGWAQLDQRDYGRIGRIVRDQFRYLDRFAGQLARGEVRPDGRFLERSKLYGRAGRQTVHLFGRAQHKDVGFSFERSFLESGNPCDLCVSESERGWVPIGELIPIGSRTCGMNDKCRIDYRKRTDAELLDLGSDAFEKLDPEAIDTFGLYARDGQFTAERRALHDAIIRQHFQGVKRSRSPRAVILGGGPAAGKSSSLRSLQLTNTMTIDVDHIRTLFPEYKEGVAAGNKAIAAFTHEEASYVAKRITARATDGHFNVLIDGTGNSSYESLAKKVTDARRAGARVTGAYTTADTDIAMQRMIDRGKKGGRFVPEDYLRQTHAGVSRVVPRALEERLFDDFTLWDNNGKEAFKILEQKDGVVTIFDDDAYKRFLDKAK